MMLEETSLLQLPSAGTRVRLSYVVEDEGGCRKGLTVIRLLPGEFPTSYDTSIFTVRPAVFADGVRVGTLDAFSSQWDIQGEYETDTLWSSGALTCVFTLLDDANVGRTFETDCPPKIASPDACCDENVFLLGGECIGTLLGELAYLPWGTKNIYPLLKLRRSQQDRAKALDLPRSGAMVTCADGTLIGVIVSRSEDGSAYAVAPLSDVLQWHRLRLMPAASPVALSEGLVTLHHAEIRPDLDPRVARLVA